MNDKLALTLRLLCFVALITCLSPAAAHAESVIACSADKLIVYPGTVVTIRVFSAEAGGPPAAAWVAEAGQIAKDADRWQWNLAGVAPGLYKAALKSAAAAPADLCEVKLIVCLPPLELKGIDRTTAASLLLRDRKEAAGYGLYSYLLLASMPDKDSEGRCLGAIEEFLKFPEVTQIEKYTSQYEGISMTEARKRINLAYIPVTTAPDAAVLRDWSEGAHDKVSRWILRNYDYARAQAIARHIQRQLQGGPYVVSILLSEADSSKVTNYLFQDQSWVPPHLIPLWMNEFLYQAAKQDYWRENTTRSLAVKLRTIVGVLAKGVPEVQQSLDKLVQWVNKSGIPGSNSSNAGTMQKGQTDEDPIRSPSSTLHLGHSDDGADRRCSGAGAEQPGREEGTRGSGRA